MRPIVPILTPRLRLDALAPDDASERYIDWLNNPASNRFLESRFAKHTPESVRAFIDAMNASATDFLLGIREIETGEHVGNIKIGPIDSHHSHAAIGLVFDRSVWGRGFATEAIAGVANFAFAALGLEKVFAGCYATNMGSIRAFEKAGFVREARLVNHWHDAVAGRVDGIVLGKARLAES